MRSSVTKEKTANVIKFKSPFVDGKESETLNELMAEGLIGDEIDDLEDLLSEFDTQELAEQEFEENGTDFFSAKNRDFNLSFQDDSIKMTEVLLEQTREIKTDLKKLKYFLDEMNLDS